MRKNKTNYLKKNPKKNNYNYKKIINKNSQKYQ